MEEEPRPLPAQGPPADVLVRPARRAEAPAIAAVVAAAFAEFHGQAPAAAWRRYEALTADALGRWDKGAVLVATRGGRLVGTVTFYPDATREGMGLPAGWAGFGSLAVAPEARGRGVGRALVAACVARAAGSGAPVLAIHTSAPMTAARRLYVAAGFRRAPALDLLASAVVPFDPAEGNVRLLAYRLDRPRGG